MSLVAFSVMIALTVSSNASGEEKAVSATPSAPFEVSALVPPTTATLENAPALPAHPVLGKPRVPESWMTDRKESRPAALPTMYATFAALQMLDVYSTRRALRVPGAYEANPIMSKVAGNSGAMIAVKAASTAASIYFTERTWKKNRKSAIIVMAIVNGATAAVASRNLKLAR
jgi:hypothetical protein